jgi:hypothetical protein
MKIICTNGEGQPENPYTAITGQEHISEYELFYQQNPKLPCFLPNSQVASDGEYTEFENVWQFKFEVACNWSNLKNEAIGEFKKQFPNQQYRQIYIVIPTEDKINDLNGSFLELCLNTLPLKEDKSNKIHQAIPLTFDEWKDGKKAFEDKPNDKGETVDNFDIAMCKALDEEEWFITPKLKEKAMAVFHKGFLHAMSTRQNLISKDKVIEAIEQQILYPALVGGKQNKQIVREFVRLIETIKQLK